MGRTAVPIYGRTPAHKRPKGETPLLAWLRATGVSRFWLARKLGCDPKMVSIWADGRGLPGSVYMIMLEIVTEGGVPVMSWTGTDLFKLTLRNCGVDWPKLLDQRREVQARRKARSAP